MNDDAITFINDDAMEDNPKKENIDPINNHQNIINNEFIKGLPDWDLEPPYEMIKRSNL